MTDLRHILSPSDLSDDERQQILARAEELSQADAAPTRSRLRVGALYFDPSLRTRVSFEAAASLLGGACQSLDAGRETWPIEMDPDAVMDGSAVENLAEAARTLGSMFHVLGVRSFRGSLPWEIERTEPVLRRVAAYAGVPVISLEGSTHHPLQALADHLTLRQTFGNDLVELPIALCWAWHPRTLPMAVPHSLLLESALAGCDVRVIHPKGYELDPGIMAQATQAAASRHARVQVFHDREEGLRDAAVVYVKSWGPMRGHGASDPSLRHWRMDEQALAAAPAAKVMHPLPVRRNVVLSGSILDGPRSLVSKQVKNRLWAATALLEWVARRQGVID